LEGQGHRSKFRVTREKQFAKVVGATSSEGFSSLSVRGGSTGWNGIGATGVIEVPPHNLHLVDCSPVERVLE